jgi:hypothetical protein
MTRDIREGTFLAIPIPSFVILKPTGSALDGTSAAFIYGIATHQASQVQETTSLLFLCSFVFSLRRRVVVQDFFNFQFHTNYFFFLIRGVRASLRASQLISEFTEYPVSPVNM